VSTREQIDRAIQSSQPGSRAGYRKALFRFARELKAIPELADAGPRQLSPLVERWFTHAQKILGAEHLLETVHIDFLRAWPKVRHPAGAGPIQELFARAQTRRVPLAGERYQNQKLRLLVSLCWELQEHAGENPWPLSCRQAGELLGVSHTVASNWLFLLVQDEVLELVSVGNQASGKASEYRTLENRKEN
jgi:hypothetical protein